MLHAVLVATALSLAMVSIQNQGTTPQPIRNFLRVNTDFCTGGQPRPEHFAQLKADGIRAVLNLRTADEYRIDDEVAAIKAAGLRYFHVPVVYTKPAAASVDEFLKVTDDPANRPLFIHCTAAIRVGAFWLIRRVVRDGWTYDAALAEARKVGLLNAPHLEDFAKAYIAAHPPVAPVEWTGRVQARVMAIGGETTGMLLETPAGRLELTGTEAIRAAIAGLDGQQVVVKGRLETRAGVEVPVRRIIHVTEIVKKP